MEDRAFDVCVVGAGVIGSAAAHDLAGRGARVLLLEQFGFGHDHGSSHGESRIIRRTYIEPWLAELMPEAYAGWSALQRACEADGGVLAPGEQLMRNTGGVDFGVAGSAEIESVISASRVCGVPLQQMSHAEVAAQHAPLLPPSHGMQDDRDRRLCGPYTCLFSPESGVLRASLCTRALQAVAARRGATLLDHAKVTGYEPLLPSGGGAAGYTVHTRERGSFRCRQLVLALGGWATGALLPRPLPLVPIEVTVAHWRMRPGLDVSRCPIFIHYGEPYSVYGLPSTRFPGTVKVCWHGGRRTEATRRGTTTTTTGVPAAVAAGDDGGGAAVPSELVGVVAPFLSRFVQSPRPGGGGQRVSAAEWLQQLDHVERCVYTMTPDEGFIIDRVPATSSGGDDDVIVAAGFSGHGFKLAPVIGRLLADMALAAIGGHGVDSAVLDKTLEPFRLSRPALATFLDGSSEANSFSGQWEERGNKAKL